jgi:hypothetical protein
MALAQFVDTVYFHLFQENVSITKSKMSPRIQVLILHVAGATSCTVNPFSETR